MAYTGKKPVDFVDVTQSQSMTVSDDLTVNNDTTVAGDLTVDTNTMYVDSANNRVGVGTDSPSKQLHQIRTGSASDLPTLAIETGFITQSTNVAASSQNISIISGNGGEGRLFFGDTDDEDVGNIVYSHANNSMSFDTAGTESMRITSDGSLLVGTNGSGNNWHQFNKAGSYAFQITQDTTNNNVLLLSGTSGSNNQNKIVFANGGTVVGSISTSAGTTYYNTTSDYRLKEDWQPMTGATERVKALNPVNFAWKVDGSRVDGFLAHEAQEVVPEAIFGEKDAMREEEYEVTPAVIGEDGKVVTEAVRGTRQVPDYQGIDQSKLVPLLTAALQEAIAKIETLEEKVAALENA